jgi:hypothetical protein
LESDEGPAELLLASGRKFDDVAATVHGIPAPRDQVALLKVI